MTDHQGRLVKEMVNLTSPRRSIYSEAIGGWTDPQGKEIVGGRLLHLLQTSLGRCGLRGIGSTLGFMVTAQLHRFVRVYSGLVTAELLAGLDSLDRALAPTSTLPDKPQKQYAAVAAIGARLMAELHETVWRCGSAQLLRAHVASALGGSTRIDCSLLSTLLQTADSALLTELRADDACHARASAALRKGGTAADGGSDAPRSPRPSISGSVAGSVPASPAAATAASSGKGSGGKGGFEEPPPPTALSEAAADLAPYLEAAGLSQPREHVMVIAPSLPRLPLCLAVFTYTQLSRVQWSSSLAALTDPKGKLTDESIDGVPLVSGIACILRQFHAEASHAYVEHLLQLVRAMLHSAFTATKSPPSEPPVEAVTMLHYLELFSRHAGVDVPGLDLYQTAVGGLV